METDFHKNELFILESTGDIEPLYAKSSVDKIYPIDIHCPAQLVATLSRLNIFFANTPLIKRVLKWTIKNMQNKEKGYLK